MKRITISNDVTGIVQRELSTNLKPVCSKTNQRGFTLIELLVVIAIWRRRYLARSGFRPA